MVQNPEGDPLAALRHDGWVHDLNLLPDGSVRCSACGAESPPDRLTTTRIEQVEGASDPDDRAIAAGCECPACGALGIVLAHVGASMEDGAALVLQALDDGRR